MKMHRSLVAVLTTAWLCAGAALPAAAEELELLEFDAFGTLGMLHSSEDQADYTRTQLVADGAGASHSWSPKVDSVLAGQLSMHFNPRLTAVVQLVAEQRAHDSYRPHLEWANLSYEITPDLTIGMGRIASPIFMHTDTRRLSYALPWMRPPPEVYDLYPATNNIGLNMHWRIRSGETSQLLEVALGRSDSDFSRNGISGTAKGKGQFIVRDTLERGPWSLVLGYSHSNLTVPELLPWFKALRSFGPAGIALESRYAPNSSSSRYFGGGISYDPGRWFLTGEWADLRIAGVLRSNTGWYATTGARFGAFTPYVTYAQMVPGSQRTDPGIDLSTLPAEQVPAAAALNAQLAYLLADVPDQTTVSLGLRWDFAASLCLKLQYDHINLAPGNAGNLANLQPGFRPGGKVNLLGATVSFVL